MDKVVQSINDRQRRTFLIYFPFIAIVLLLLAGCGGSGSDDSSPPANNPPSANDDAASTNENTPVVIDVVGNDSDDDGTIDTNSVTIVEQPSNGSINNNGDGTVRYTPNPGFGGANDSFTYTVRDDDGAVSNEATVTVTVIAVNVPPTVENFCDKTKLNTPLTGSLSNLVTDQDSDVFNFRILSNGQKGTADIDLITGNFTYTPNQDAKGADTFTFEVDDLDGGTAAAEAEVIIGDTRIMPFGDSITAGIFGMSQPPGGPPPEQSERIGYRKKLYADLNDTAVGGFQVDFVGSQNDGLKLDIIDPDHEGWPGRRDDDFLDNIDNPPRVTALLDANPADIILLHIGSNDVNEKNQGGTADVDADDVEAILQEIDTWETTNNPVTVFLALITDRRTQFQELPNPDVDEFNNNIKSLAEARIDAGDDIVIVNQHDALTYPDDLSPDQVHPTIGGYEKMANTWLESIISSEKAPRCPPSP